MGIALRYLAAHGITAELLLNNRVRLTPLGAVSGDIVRFMAAWKPLVIQELANGDPLDGLPLLPDDRRFIDTTLAHRGYQARMAALAKYRDLWLEAAAVAWLKPHERDNAGRYASNTWLRTLLPPLAANARH